MTRPRRPAGSSFDRSLLLLALPATLFMVAVFVYPFLYGLQLSFRPMEGAWLANYTSSSPPTTCGTPSAPR
jgi:ABC-type sugar transport system permease subunit